MRCNPNHSDISRALLIGATAGLAASFVMNVFQDAVTHFGPDNDNDDAAAEPATEKAADDLASVLGTTLSDETRPAAGEAIHYLLGAVLGATYAMAAEYEPGVTKGAGAAFGVTTAAMLDDVAVPATGLSEAPWTFPASTHLYGLASHLVFGMTVDGVRRVLRRIR
ncbi:DUF1440 domain-containing protein [Sphingomonas arantia]|uniref:DUF1440 domain-containing protein n=1 Tax=Sphingomonas arantia TaxID=1460676 RepID=A0ABW4TXW1_9SPHN